MLHFAKFAVPKHSSYSPKTLSAWKSTTQSIVLPSSWGLSLETVLWGSAGSSTTSPARDVDVVAVVGPQGSGKSTLATLLLNAAGSGSPLAAAASSVPGPAARPARPLALLDCDVGQSLLGGPGLVCGAVARSKATTARMAAAVTSGTPDAEGGPTSHLAGGVQLPWLLEPPACCDGARPMTSPRGSVCFAYGATSPEADPRGFVACCVAAGRATRRLLEAEAAAWASAGEGDGSGAAGSSATGAPLPRPLLVVNTCGWVKGAGLMTLRAICAELGVTSVMTLGAHGASASASGGSAPKRPLRVLPPGVPDRGPLAHKGGPWEHLDLETAQAAVKKVRAAARAARLETKEDAGSKGTGGSTTALTYGSSPSPGAAA